MKLNENIVNLRNKIELTQEEFAEVIGVSVETIVEWESGVSSPSPEQLLFISHVFKISVDDLLGNDINQNNSNYIYKGASIIGGALMGIWAFTANRFTYNEIALVIIGGSAMGYGIGLVIDGMLKNIDWKAPSINNAKPKSLIKKL